MDEAERAISPLQLTTCPQCGLSAEVGLRTVLESTDGPIEHVRLVCVDRHWFMLSVAALDPPARSVQARHPSPAPVRGRR